MEFETCSGQSSELERRCEAAVASFRDAATQRAQAAVIKVLGAALAEAHQETEALLDGEQILESGRIASWNMSSTRTTADVGNQDSGCRCCEVAALVIAHILLSTPSAPWVVTCAALRALLRTSPIIGRCGKPPILVAPVLNLFARLGGYALHDSKMLPCDPNVLRLVCGVHAVNALNSENETRGWVFENLKRLVGASTAALGVVRAFLSSVEGCSTARAPSIPGVSDALEFGLDAALKVLQDACRCNLDMAATSAAPSFKATCDVSSQ